MTWSNPPAGQSSRSCGDQGSFPPASKSNLTCRGLNIRNRHSLTQQSKSVCCPGLLILIHGVRFLLLCNL